MGSWLTLVVVFFTSACFIIWTADGVGDYPFRNVSLPWEERVDDLVGRLTLEEIQQQMGNGGSVGPAPAIPRLGIGPYMFATECLRGDVKAPGNATQFPQALGLAATFSPDLLYLVAQATGEEVRGKHNDLVRQGVYDLHTGASCFSPVVNIMRDSRWGRNQETYGEDPFLSGVMATAFIRGLQGNDTRYVRASGGCKHFDVYGGPENIPVSRVSFDAIVSEEDWRMTFLPAFRKCVEAGTYSLMCSCNRINGIPSCADKYLLSDIARNEWGFKGYVVSDEAAIENIINYHHYINNSVDTVAACVNAGCNLELPSKLTTTVYFSMMEAIKQGKLTEQKVRESVRPLFYTRMRLGEFDPPEMNPYSRLSSAEVESPQHRELAVEAAMKSFVLLKNTGILPLDLGDLGKFGTIGIVGPFANTTELAGDYAPSTSTEYITTPLEVLSPLGQKVQYAAGCDQVRDGCQHYDAQSVIKAVSYTDIIFVLLGTGAKGESEANDRPDTELPGKQRQLLLDVCHHTNNSFIVIILFNAGPVNITFADELPQVGAILECFFPAQATGEALRHVLLNDVNGAVPAGRLPFTWPLLASQLPPMVNYSMTGRTYRYFEGEPLYPFGYGLSYTSFRYTDLFCPFSISAGQSLYGSVTLANVGHVDADEVVQVYIRWTNTSLPAPKLQLAWFKRIPLRAGQQVVLKFEIEAWLMALWIHDSWRVEPGVMDIFVGGQQPLQKRRAPSNVLSTQFRIMGTARLGRY